MINNSIRARRTIAGLSVVLLGGAGLWLGAVGPGQRRRPQTCHGLTATIVGTSGADELNGTSGRDVIVGLGGNDEIDGNGGNDVICARRRQRRGRRRARQRLHLRRHRSRRVDGESGRDTMWGGSGRTT